MFSKYDPNECARYNEIHLCMGSIHCPCQVIQIPGEELDNISSHYDGCLCDDCMEELKREKS